MPTVEKISKQRASKHQANDCLPARVMQKRAWLHGSFFWSGRYNMALDIKETLQGVLGSGENGVQKYREQGAWGQNDQGAGSKGK